MPNEKSKPARVRRDLHIIDARTDTLALMTQESNKDARKRLKLEDVARVHREPTMEEFVKVLTARA